MTEKIKMICVCGPTACGKTALGVQLALSLGGEVVSADSMQLYRGAHIASAAADEEEMRGVKHHLLEFLDGDEPFTVYDYLLRARAATEDIHSRGKLPITVGGTGLYINALSDGVKLQAATTDGDLRRALEERFEAEGGEKMLETLKSVDPAAAAKLCEKDKRRIVRALEIFELTGRTKTELDAASKSGGSDYDCTILGITFSDRQLLYDRINARVDLMLEKGLLTEAKAAFDRGENHVGGVAQAIGHKEFFPYFRGEIPLEEAVENLKRQTRRYAKRQLTWFGRREDINWIYADKTDVFTAAKEILERKGYVFEGQ